MHSSISHYETVNEPGSWTHRFRLSNLMIISTMPGAIVALILGLGVAAIGFFIPGLLGGRGPEWGVMAMMLTAAPAAFIFPMQTEIAKSNAWPKQWLLYFCFFLGVMGWASTWAVIHPADEVWDVFGFLAQLPEVSTASLDQGSFASAWKVIPHNLGVALAVVFLTLIYGVAGGSALLTWNVCVWGITLTTMIQRSAETTGFGTSIIAVVPHTVVEMAAYSLVVLAAVDLRQSGASASPRWARMAAMLSFALILIVIAGLLESGWTKYVLERP